MYLLCGYLWQRTTGIGKFVKSESPNLVRERRMFSRAVKYFYTFVAVFGGMTFGYSGFAGGSLSSTLATFHQHVCDGQTMFVKCPKHTVISIQFAQYGRQVPSSQMCPVSLLPDRTYASYGYYSPQQKHGREDTNCQATTSLQVLLDLCQNRHICHLVASAETFGQDPCPDTTKYLEIAYKCHPNGYESEVVCEGEQMVLWCKRSTRVAIYSAMFGRAPNGTSVCENTGPSNIDCQARNTIEAVRDQCHGHKQCVLEAEEYMFGNPCTDGVNKYLNVTYTCVPKKIFKAVRVKERRRHHKKKNREKKKDKKDRKKPLRSSSTEAEVYTKQVPDTSTPSYRTVEKIVTPDPEQASADAADVEREDTSSPASTHKKDESGEKDKSKPHLQDNNSSSSEENNPTVVCVNYTVAPVGSSRSTAMGAIVNWLNAVDFLSRNTEKVVLYFVLGVCVGIIILLTVILIKIGRDFKRNVRAKLDVTEPTHSHNVTSNHHPLEGTLERAESIDRIEVVRFSPRGTLRNDNGTRSLSNYYG